MRELRREMWGSCTIPCQSREVLEEKRRKEEGKRGKRESGFHIPCRVKVNYSEQYTLLSGYSPRRSMICSITV